MGSESILRRNDFIRAGRDDTQRVTNGSEETADPQPAGASGQCFRWGRVGWFYSHDTLRRSGCAEASRRVCLALCGARERCERRERASDGWLIQQPVKARAARGAREQDHGGGHGGAPVERRRARRVGTRSGYGSTGGRGILCGAERRDRGAGAVAVRNPHYAKSIFKHLLMGYRAAVRRSFISPYWVGDRR